MLPKESLIRANAEYVRCYAEGCKVHTRHFLLFIVAKEQTQVRMGTAVSRKIGSAVVRNRVKRLLKECFRLYIRPLPIAADLVVVAKRHTACEDLDLETTKKELLAALDKHYKDVV